MKLYSSLCKCGLVFVDQIPFRICKELTVIYVLSNDLVMRTVSGDFRMHPGDIEIINVLEPVELIAPEKPAEVLFFSFDKAWLDTIDFNFESVTYNCNICNFFSAQADRGSVGRLKQMMLQICDRMTQEEDYDAVKSDVEEFLGYIRQNFDDVAHLFSTESKQESKKRVQMLSEYMIEHVSDKISLDDLSSVVYVSKQYLSKLFSNKLGKNYQDVINYYRVINAVIQLLETDNTLTYIAETSGFSSVNYYNKVFKTYLHCLPSKFRSMYKNAEQGVRFAEITEEQLGQYLELDAREFLTKEYSFRRQMSGGSDRLSLCIGDEPIEIPVSDGDLVEVIVRVRSNDQKSRN